MNWIHNRTIINNISQFPDNALGFVYVITNLDTNQYYIGRKELKRKVTKQPLKGYKKKRVDYNESNWLTYQSSNKDVQAWDNVEKRILTLCYSKLGLTYFETKAIFCIGGLEDEKCMNGNILGKFYKDKVLYEFQLEEDNKLHIPTIES